MIGIGRRSRRRRRSGEEEGDRTLKEEEEEDGRARGGRTLAEEAIRGGGDEGGQSAVEALPRRVGELFQMHNFASTDSAGGSPFFRSVFLRDKLPQMMFSNGTSGLSEIGGGAVVRHIPIKLLTAEKSSSSSSSANIPLPLPSASSSSDSPSSSVSIVSTPSENRTADDQSTDMASTPATSTASSASLSSVSWDIKSPPNSSLFPSSSSSKSNHRPPGQIRSPELRRHFDSLFWTPQQARRIAEREQQQEHRESPTAEQQQRKCSLGELPSNNRRNPLNKGPLSGSTITVYSIPISKSSSNTVELPVTRRERSTPGRVMMEERKRDEAGGGTESPGPYSAIPFKRGSLNPATSASTPSLFDRNQTVVNSSNSSCMADEKKPPRPPPPPPSAFPSSRPPPPPLPSLPPPPSSSSSSSPSSSHHHHSPAGASSLPPLLRRAHTALSLPQQQQQMLLRRDSEPAIVVLGSEFDGEVMNGRVNQKVIGEHGTKSAASLPGTSDDPAVSEDRSSLSGSVSCSSSSSTAIQNRPKSPSLSSIRQSLFRFRSAKKTPPNSSSSSSTPMTSLVPSCVRSRQSSGSEAEEEKREDREREANTGTGQGRLWKNDNGAKKEEEGMINSPLTTSTLRLTEFVPRKTEDKQQRSGRKEAEEDAVEEAIRSLEQFDPSDFVSKQYREGTARRISEDQPPKRGNSPFMPPKVFLAKAEPVQLHSSDSTSSILSASSPLPERRLSLASLPFSSLDSFANSVPQLPPPVRRPSTVSSGSATPTIGSFSSSHQQMPSSSSSISVAEPMFSQSMDSINRTPRANSPSAHSHQSNNQMPEISQLLISRLKDSDRRMALEEEKSGGTNRRGVTFNDNPTQHFYAPFDGPPPDYSDSDEEEGPNRDNGSVADSEDGEANAAAVEAEAHLRKRFLCSQLTDCAKVVEINALKMSQFVAAGIGHGGWRQSHILRHNLAAIRDTVYTIEFALDELVESLGRISLDVRDYRHTQLEQLCRPVQTSLKMLRRLRHSLDSTGWSLSALSRSVGSYAGHDALDQFVAILPQLPKDCYKLVQWVYSLSLWRDDSSSGTVSSVFLPSSAILPSSSSFHPSFHHPPPPPPAPFFPPLHRHRHHLPPLPSSQLSSPLLNYYSSDSTEDENHNEENGRDKDRSSSVDDRRRGIGGGNSGGMEKERKLMLLTRGRWPTRNGTMNEVMMDGGESTSSTSSIMTLEERAEDNNNNRSPPVQRMPNADKVPSSPPATNNNNEEEEGGGDIVMEEDDLQSVLSESTGNDRLAEFHPPATGGLNGSSTPARRFNAELARSLTSDQRDLFRLYEPQICSHISALSRSIEEFFSLIETQSESKLSFQKVQMIFIEGHSLVGILRVLARDDCIAQHRPLSTLLEHESGRMDALLNECLATAKVAKAKTQTVSAVQAVCSAVVAVSESAHQLKGFWRICGAGAVGRQ